MELEEAFNVLGVEASADPTEIDQAFRLLAHERHPDKGGSRQAWDQLLEAYGVATVHANAGGRRSDTPGQILARRGLEDIATSGRLAHQDLIGLRHAQTAEVKQSVIRRRTSPLVRAKRRAWLFAGLGAVGTVLLQLIKAWTPTISLDRPSEASLLIDTYSLYAMVIVALVALFGLFYKLRADSIEHAVEDLVAELGDRDLHLPLLNELARTVRTRRPAASIPVRPGVQWTRKDLEDAIGAWSAASTSRLFPVRALRRPSFGPPALSNLAGRIGSADTARLIIAKGVEAETLVEDRGNGGRTTYLWQGVGDGAA